MITEQRTVQADPQRLWAVLSQLSQWAELLPTVDRVVTTSAEPGVGARYALNQPGIPRLVYEVTEWLPGEGFTWIAAAPGVRTVGTHSISPSGTGCVLTMGLRWEGPFRSVVDRLFGARTARYVRQEAEAFAHLAEHVPQSQ